MTTEDEGPGSIELSDPHVVAGILYARAVVAGEIVAGRLARLACKRALADLERSATDPSYPYDFDEARASRPCRFLEALPHVKGPKANAGERLTLEPWQCFLVTVLFGWVHKSSGKRRFRRAYWEVARGNGKTFLLAGLCLYMLAADGEEGAEVFSAATTKDQAKLVFGSSQAMLRKNRELAHRLGLRDTTHAIIRERTHSKFAPLSREADNQDGLNLHYGCVDELHAHKTREVYDVLETALGKRDQSLLHVITTAGSDTSGICYEIRGYLVKLLEGHFEDDQFFGIIYTIDEDEGDDWTDPTIWPKANPNWGVSVMPDVIAGLARKAQQVSSAQNNFKTKHLNVWCNADVSWMNMVAWDRCGDPDLQIERFLGQDLWSALDLASRIDLACRALIFREYPSPIAELLEAAREFPELVTVFLDPRPAKADKAHAHYYLFVFSYLPEEAIEDARNASYEGWEREGWIKTTPGNSLDFDIIQSDVIADRDAYRLRECAFDPYQAPQLASHLVNEGVEMVEYRNTVLTMSPPMKELEALVLEGRLHHNANPCMRWMISNVVCHRDAKDNIFPRKERVENKIDGPVASIMALGRAMVAEDQDPYEDNEVLLL